MLKFGNISYTLILKGKIILDFLEIVNFGSAQRIDSGGHYWWKNDTLHGNLKQRRESQTRTNTLQVRTLKQTDTDTHTDTHTHAPNQIYKSHARIKSSSESPTDGTQKWLDISNQSKLSPSRNLPFWCRPTTFVRTSRKIQTINNQSINHNTPFSK